MKALKTLSRATIALHWIVAIGVAGLLVMGIYMSKLEVWGLFELHKSIGVLVFGVVLWRVLTTLRNGWPEPASETSRAERRLAKAAHWVLIAGTVAMPISGMLYSALSGHHVGLFALEFFPANVDPANPGEAISRSPYFEELAHGVHEYIGYLLATVIVLHIAGALKHHFVYKNSTLLRMLGK